MALLSLDLFVFIVVFGFWRKLLNRSLGGSTEGSVGRQKFLELSETHKIEPLTLVTQLSSFKNNLIVQFVKQNYVCQKFIAKSGLECSNFCSQHISCRQKQLLRPRSSFNFHGESFYTSTHGIFCDHEKFIPFQQSDNCEDNDPTQQHTQEKTHEDEQAQIEEEKEAHANEHKTVT